MQQIPITKQTQHQRLNRNNLWVLFKLSNHCGETTTLLTIKDIQLMTGLGRDVTRKALSSLSKEGYIQDFHTIEGREIKVKKFLHPPTENQEGLLKISSTPLLKISSPTENQEGSNNNKASHFEIYNHQENNLDMPKNLEKYKKEGVASLKNNYCSKSNLHFKRTKWVSENFEKKFSQYLENSKKMLTVNVIDIIYTIVIYNLLCNNRLLNNSIINTMYLLFTYSINYFAENFENQNEEEKPFLKEKEKITPQVAAAPPKKKKKEFEPPTIEELVEIAETNLELDSPQAEKLASDFHHHYTKTEWKVGAGTMRDVPSSLKKFMAKKNKKPIIGFADCKDWWVQNFPEQYFDGREAGALKSIIEKLTHTFRVFRADEAYNPDASEMFLSFKRLVEQRPEWLKTPSISSINSNYNVIITHIKQTGGVNHGTETATTKKRSERTTDEIRQDTLNFLAKERARKETLRQKYGDNI